MFTRFALGSLLVAALCQAALANGRAPGTSTINFRRGAENQIAAGMTFGLVVSKDNGATWSWMCEEAIGYGGTYDPDYAFMSTGALFGTTFDGLKVMRDGCAFAPTSLGTKFVSAIGQGPNGSLYYAAAHPPTPPTDPGDSNIYRSDDDGMTWPVTAMPGILNDWWQSIEVAPSDPNRVYLAGYRLPPGQPKEFLLFRSNDAGVSWQPLPIGQFATMPNSTIEIAGISKTNPNLVFARVTLEDNAIADALYRSTDGGQNWTRILGKRSSLSFIVRGNGDLVAATALVDSAEGLGAFRSTDNGANWTELVSPPHISCLAENSAGEVWACTQNYGAMQVPADGFGIMKTTDLVNWTGVLRFQGIKEPVSCADGTVQKDTCDTQLWCGLCAQLGCDPKRQCAGGDSPAADITPAGGPGCCKNSAAPTPGALVLVIFVGMVLVFRRRRPSPGTPQGRRS